jgi:hypothetical protein
VRDGQQPEFPPLCVRNVRYHVIVDEDGIGDTMWVDDPAALEFHNVACRLSPLSISQYVVDRVLADARDIAEKLAVELPIKVFRRASDKPLEDMIRRYAPVDYNAVLLKWPQWEDVKRAFNARRQHTIPSIGTLDDIPPEFMFTRIGNWATFGPQHPLHQQPFIRLVRIELPQLILCVSNSAVQHMVTRCRTVIADGTFRCAPQGVNGGDRFRQLYTLHTVDESGENLPAVHVVMSSKTQQAYTIWMTVLRAFMTQAAGNNGLGTVEYWMADYEQSAAAAVADVFPEITRLHCCFHYSQVSNL